MPELPDIVVYLDSLERLLVGTVLERVVIKSPFLMRTFEPEIGSVEGQTVRGFSRIGKRIVWQMEDTCLVFHLMIAGRFHWKKPGVLPKSKMDLAAFQFGHGTMMLTEASQKKRAALHVIADEDGLKQFERGGLEPLEMSFQEFAERIKLENRTLKRALTDPRLFSGIGNAYSDEILVVAGLSPLQRTGRLTQVEIRQLFDAIRNELTRWIDLLRKQAGAKFPEKVTAFRPEMRAHGKFGQPCAICLESDRTTLIQRIVYAANECNYCPRCQTGSKMLADRSLSRLLKDDWPKTVEELEES